MDTTSATRVPPVKLGALKAVKPRITGKVKVKYQWFRGAKKIKR